MHVSSTPPVEPKRPFFAEAHHCGARSHALHLVLAVESIGYLVPPIDFTGQVHSVFATACNWTCGDGLLTVCDSGTADGPTMLRLARGAAGDLRKLFDVGQAVQCRQGRARAGRTELDLMHARVWRPAATGALLEAGQIDRHLRLANQRLAQRRSTAASVIETTAAPVAHELQDACRGLDIERAARQVDRLIGWGEGLTPAGDDFLVGVMAGLGARVLGDPQRQRFHDGLGEIIAAGLQRTTAIAAHYLGLAARGHFTETLVGLRNALLGDPRDGVVEASLQRALAVGATSGADTVSGLLAGLAAWQPSAVATA